MKRIFLTAAFASALAAGGVVAAQATAATPDDHAAHHPGAGAPADAKGAKPGGMPGDGATCGHMMGGGMGPMMMGGGMGPMMMGGAATKVDVKKIDKGVTITLTATDPAAITRLQKMAEAMRLMHEATAP